MRYTTLGATGIRVSEVFFGAMTFGEQGEVGAPLADCQAMLDTYLDAGGNVVDTPGSSDAGYVCIPSSAPATSPNSTTTSPPSASTCPSKSHTNSRTRRASTLASR